HGGNRALEFELRLNGASYEEVARAGGGIVSTVKSTRNASEAELLEQALARVDVLLSEGVTTLEIKSGYGLDIDTEIRMLRVAREVARARDVRVRTSFLGAHAMPPEYAGRADAYIDEICLPALTSAHEAGLADAVDGFCEGIAFSAGQIERVFEKARELGLPVKLHAEQLSNLGGTLLAARYGALSSDHLEHAGDAEAAAMAEAGMTAVILPGAYYTLRDTRPPPIDLFRKHRVAMAIATDCNPGSSPMTSLLLAMNMGCTLFGMTPQETLAGATVHAARALGLNDCGQLVRGMRADLAVWNVEHPRELSYRIGFNPLWKRVFGESS
ncbi:MAG: imidazolonepropionase, partial [Rhizobiaceae bacterium]